MPGRLNSPALSLLLSLCALLLPSQAHAACGDGRVDDGEDCDDGGVADDDGCDSSCGVEDGWECTVADFSADFSEIFEERDGGTHPAPDWTLSADSLTVSQTVNSAASIYNTNLDAAAREITFEVAVNTTSDDDFIGWAVAFQEGDSVATSTDWLLFDWKQGDQSSDAYGAAEEGLRLWRVSTGVDTADLWSHGDGIELLAEATTLADTGWADETTYTVTLSYALDRVQVWVDDTEEFDVSGTFPEGAFGFYTFSQPYSSFTLVDPINESICLALDSDSDGLLDPDELDVGTDRYDADTDDDGLDDREEVEDTTTDPLDEDTDDDGLSDGDEVDEIGTDPLDPDTDDDGLSDLDESFGTGTDPLDEDTDDDGLSDGAEVDEHGTDPLDDDTDLDGLGDGVEVLETGTDPLDRDTDDDELDDREEVEETGTDALDADSDDDGLSDGAEVDETGTDPLDPDSDDGGVSDGDEVLNDGTDPREGSDDITASKDSDGDGLSDRAEVDEHGTDRYDEDTDDDGLSDGTEVDETTTDPLDGDTDDDGLSDGTEVNETGTDPLNPDTDGGGVPDGEEVARDSDPLQPADDLPTVDTGDSGDTDLADTGEPVDTSDALFGEDYKGGGGCACSSTSRSGFSPLLLTLLALVGLRRAVPAPRGSRGGSR